MAFDLNAPVSMPSLIERATTSYLVTPDWAINIQICDMCSRDQMLAAEAVALVKKKIKDKNPTTIVLALHLLEALMKNSYVFMNFFLLIPVRILILSFSFLKKMVCNSTCESKGISHFIGPHPQGQEDQVSGQGQAG